MTSSPSRPALANLFAVYDQDPQALDTIERRLRASNHFAAVYTLVPGWIIGWAPLPGSSPDGSAAIGAALAFAEGRDTLVADDAQDKEQRFSDIAELAHHQPDQLARLHGDFGFIHCRPHGSATVVCSAAGLVPFYWSRHGSTTAIGTRLSDFVYHLPGPWALDPMQSAIVAAGASYGPGLATYLQGVSRIPHGTYAVVNADQTPTPRQYWDPRPQRLVYPTPDRRVEHQQRLRALLLARLQRDLNPAGGNLLTLSGGVDSSSLAALAAGTLGLPLAAWSLVSGPDEPYVLNRSYIQPLVEQFQISPHWEVRSYLPTHVELLPQAPPAIFPILHPALCALSSVHREWEVRVLVGGEFSDNFLGGLESWPDWADAVSPLQLALSLALRQNRLPLAKYWARLRRAEILGKPPMPQPAKLRPFIRAELQDEYKTWYEEREREVARDKRPMRFLAQWIAEDYWVTMNWEATSVLGIRRSLPFYNREVLELGFDLHPLEWGVPGNKAVLRAALKEDVPAHNLSRPDKGFWGRYLQGQQLPWAKSLPESLSTIVRPELFTNPPDMLDLTDATMLTGLVVFAAKLEEANRTIAPMQLS